MATNSRANGTRSRKQKAADFERKGSMSVADRLRGATACGWADADEKAILAGIYAATEYGDAIMFTRTRDGTGLGITIYSEDENSKVYGSANDMSDILYRLAESYAVGKEGQEEPGASG